MDEYKLATRKNKMYISYRTQKLKKICTATREAKRHLPTQRHVDRLFQRLNELGSLENLDDVPVMPPMRRHKLSGKLKDCWAVDIAGKKDGWRIVFFAVPLTESESAPTELYEIKAICIKEIRDYHRG